MSLLIVVRLALGVSGVGSMALLKSESWSKADMPNHGIWEGLEGKVMEETRNSKRHIIHKAGRGGYKRLKSSTT